MKKYRNSFCIILVALIGGCQLNNTNSSQGISSNNGSTNIIEESSKVSSSSSFNDSVIKVDKETILSAMDLAINNKDKVQKGSLVYKTTSERKYEYSYGSDSYGNFTNLKNISNNVDTYYGYNASEKFYGINVDSKNKITGINNPNELNILGPAINPLVTSNYYYGAENLLEHYKTLVTENQNLDFEIEGAVPSTSYKFTIGFAEVISNAPRLYVSTVQFTNSDNVLTSLNVKVEKYENTTTTTNVIPDFSTGTYYLNNKAKPFSTCEITYTQNVGERNAVNPYNIEEFYYSSFELEDENGNKVNDKLTLKNSVEHSFKVVDYLPSTALSTVDKLSVKVVEGANAVSSSYDFNSGTLKLKGIRLDTCKIEISSEKVTKTIDVNVIKPDPQSMSVIYFTKNNDSYEYNMVNDNHITIFEGTDIYLKGNVSPSSSNPEFGVKALGDNADKLSFEATTIQSGVVEHNVYKTSFAELGVYTVYIYSLATEKVNQTVTIEVVPLTPLEELLSRRYVMLNEVKEIGVEIKFYPNEGDPTRGFVTLYDSYDRGGVANFEFNYVYDESTKVFALTDKATNEAVKQELMFNDKLNLIYGRANPSTYVQLSVYSELLVLRGEWSGAFLVEDGGNTRHTIDFFIHENGETSFTYSRIESFSATDTFRAEINVSAVRNEDDTVSITIDADSMSYISENSKFSSISNMVCEKSVITLNLVFDGVEYTAKLSRGK